MTIMSFSETYRRCQRLEWCGRYVDYDLLVSEACTLAKSLSEWERCHRIHRRRRHGHGYWYRNWCRSDDHRGGGGGRRGGRGAAAASGESPHEKRRRNRSPPRLEHRRYRSTQGLPYVAKAADVTNDVYDHDHDHDDTDHCRGEGRGGAVPLVNAVEKDRHGSDGSMNRSHRWSFGNIASLGREKTVKGGSSVCHGGNDDDDDNEDSIRIKVINGRDAFVDLLDAEVERAALFILSETGKLAEEVSALLAASRSPSSFAAAANEGDAADGSPIDGYRSVAFRLSELYLFAAVNLTAVRKALERHDDLVRGTFASSSMLPSLLFGGKSAPILAQWYVRTRTRGGRIEGGVGIGIGRHDAPSPEWIPHPFDTALSSSAVARLPSLPSPPHFESLMSHDGLESVRRSVIRGFAIEAEKQKKRLDAGAVLCDDDGGMIGREAVATLCDDDTFWTAMWMSSDPALVNMDAVADRLKKAEHGSLKDYVVLGSLGNTLALEPTVISGTISEHDLDLAFYVSRREWIVQKLEHGQVVGSITPNKREMQEGRLLVGTETQTDEKVKETSCLDYYLPLGLNLFSTFLYMVNYFIAGPTSAVYIETLGGNKALAGMVIGATPWAVIISSVLFSVWTNYSFKAPLLFSGVCQCIGNLMYGCAYRFDSIALVMIGRVAVGLGGPRVINRRYIADICPLESRTSVSAAFVTLSAAGVAVGPGLSAVLQSVDFSIVLPFLGEVEMNGLTTPGYLMFLVWLIFVVILVVAFHEPERIGLQQLQDKEALMFSSDIEASGVECSEMITAGPAIDHSSGSRQEMIPSVNENDSGEEVGYGQYASTYKRDIATNPTAVDTESELNRLIQNAPEQSRANYSSTFYIKEADKEGSRIIDGEEIFVASDPLSVSSVASRKLFCCQHFNLQVWICIILLFVNKFAQEAVISASPIITDHRYGWSVEMIGALGVATGTLVIPLSVCVGWLSMHFEDRVILRWLLLVSVLGLLILVDFRELMRGDSMKESHDEGSSFVGVGPHRYVFGCLVAFSGFQCMESVIMSALSKVVPHSLAVGICNSGLINTETGTLGRAMGDLAVTIAGLVSIHGMLNTLMLPLVFIVVACIAMVQLNYDNLAV